MKRRFFTAMVAVSALAVASCGGDDADDGAGAPTEASEPAEPTEPVESAEPTEAGEPAESAEPTEAAEPTEPAETAETAEPTEPTEPAPPADPITISLALYPSLDYPAIYLGQRDGIFEKHGIDLEIEQVLTGTGLMSAITSGQFDLATNSVTGGVTGILSGLPVQMVSVTSYQPTEGNVEVLVPADSDIQTFADLAGKSVATINLQGLFHLGILNAVVLEGGDPAAVEAVPMGATDEAPALEAGRVDAIMIQDPFLTTIKAEYDFRSLGNPFGVLPYQIPAGAVFTSLETIEKNPEMIERWRAAFGEATAYANEHPELIDEIIPTYTDITPDQLASLGIPDLSDEIDPDGLLAMFQSMVDYTWLKYVPSVSQVYWSPEGS